MYVKNENGLDNKLGVHEILLSNNELKSFTTIYGRD